MNKSSTTKSTTTSSQSKSSGSQQKSTSSANSLEKFKMEAASEVGVQLKDGYNGNLTSKQAGSIGGQMVKKMIDSYKSQK
jgi:hypothetical protein